MSQPFVDSSSKDWATPIAPIPPPATVPVQSSTTETSNTGPYRTANDWTKGCRLTWIALNRTFAASKYSAAFFAILPSLYISGVMIAINVKLGGGGNNPMFVYQLQMVQALTQFFGIIAGFTYFFNLLAVISIMKRWPGVLSFCAWTQEVMEHFFVVSFIILLLLVGYISSLISAYRVDWNIIYGSFLSPLFACFFFAIISFALSASVSVAFRIQLSGVD